MPKNIIYEWILPMHKQTPHYITLSLLIVLLLTSWVTDNPTIHSSMVSSRYTLIINILSGPFTLQYKSLMRDCIYLATLNTFIIIKASNYKFRKRISDVVGFFFCFFLNAQIFFWQFKRPMQGPLAMPLKSNLICNCYLSSERFTKYFVFMYLCKHKGSKITDYYNTCLIKLWKSSLYMKFHLLLSFLWKRK